MQILGVNMKLVKGKSAVAVLFLLLVATGLLASRAYASTPTTNSIDLPVQTHFVGDVFEVNVTISDAPGLFVWQVKVFYNTSILNCTAATYPTGHVFDGHTFIPVTPVIDNVEGYALHGASLVGEDFVDVIFATPLCSLQFEALALGDSFLNFSRPYGADTFAQNGTFDDIPFTELEIIDGNITVEIPEFNVSALTLLFLFSTLIILVVSRKALPRTVRAAALNSR
jgi:hypothetical protein